MFNVWKEDSRLHLQLIALIGLIVPRRLRADWRQEWEAELRYREAMLADWDRLDFRHKVDLLWRSSSAFWDALWLQQLRWEDEMIQDLRYGVRMLLKTPGFTSVAIITLALGIGANTALFSVVNAVLWRPLPYPHAEQLVRVDKHITAAHFLALSQQKGSFDGVAAWSSRDFTLTRHGNPEQLKAYRISPELLPLLGVTPLTGRAFAAEEFQAGRDHVTLISHRLWRNRFGSDLQLVGEAVTLDELRYTVVGVLPQQFDFFPSVDFLMPLALTAEDLSEQHYYGLEVVARLSTGTTLEQAKHEVDASGGRLASQRGVGLQPLREVLVKDFRLTLLVLWGVVGCVLLIACANYTNLMLARAAARRKELAIRAAIGARPARLVRQLLTEGLLVSGLGACVGLLCAYLGVRALLAANPAILPRLTGTAGMATIPRLGEVSIDGSVMAFTLLLALLTGVLVGLAPALQFSRPELSYSLKEGAAVSPKGYRFGRHQRTQGLLVIGQIALSLVLLAGAGLLIRSFWSLQQVEPGFQPERLLTLQLEFPWFKYRQGAQVTAFVKQLSEQLDAVQGVEGVGAASSLPLTKTGGFGSIVIEGRPDLVLNPRDLPSGAPPPPGPPPGSPGGTFTPGPVAFNSDVGPHYFRTMGIPLRQGREFDYNDNPQSLRVAIINEAMAGRYWPGEDPVGKRLQCDGSESWRTVVGVVGNVKRFALEDQATPELYLPFSQPPEEMSGDRGGSASQRLADHISLVVRTTGQPEEMAEAVRQTVWRLDPDQPILQLVTMEQRLAEVFGPRRFNMLLFGVFALVALLLAGVGIYGVMSYTVAQRTHEVGIRLALGAQAGDVLRLIIRQGMQLVLAGLPLGLAAALGLTKLLKNLLFGVSATDPLTFSAIALLPAGVALLACYLPARRAAKVDPLVALRHE